MLDRYFDNAATTPLDSRVREAMRPYLDEWFGNANSIHALGLKAREAVERARGQVAMALGAEDPSQIIFTSGATEANNWVLNAGSPVFFSPFEHSAMREPALRRTGMALANTGLAIHPRPSSGAVDWPSEIQTLRDRAELEPDAKQAKLLLRTADSLEAFQEDVASGLVTPSRPLVTVMAVNNEIGTSWHARDYAHDGDLVHSDITQAVGKVRVELEGLDYASFSAHKFYGPKGIGALYCREVLPPPLIVGGEQEHGYRGGTLNVPAIVGMGAAAEIAAERREEDFAQAQNLSEILMDGLKGLADTRFNGGDRTSPFIVSVSFQGLEGEALVLEMDRAGYAISSGAACSSRSTEPSHVLSALKIEPEWLRGTVRISFGRMNSKEATASLAKMMRTTVELLRTL